MDWAVVAATLVGPVLAVQAQKYLERWREAGARRERIFKILMATRASRLSMDHVSSLNLIDIEFPATKRFKKARSGWRAYRTHLNESPPTDPQLAAVFFAKRDELFTDMLYEMGLSLGFDFDKTQIGRDVYSTVYHGKLEADQETIRTKLVEILTGKAALPMSVVEFPSDPEFLAAQTEYLRLMAEYVKNGKPWPIAVIDSGASAKVVPMRPPDQKTDATG